MKIGTILKRIFIISFTLIMLSNYLYSIELGIVPKLGGGFSYSTGVEEARSKFSFLAGGGIISRFSDLFTLELDLVYQIKGGYDKRIDSTLTFLSVPLTGRIKFIEHLSFLIGPQISFMLNANTNGINTSNYTRSTNYDLVFGASYYILQGNDRLIFEFIVEAGLTDLSMPNHPFTKTNSKNRAGYFVVGWEFSL